MTASTHTQLYASAAAQSAAGDDTTGLSALYRIRYPAEQAGPDLARARSALDADAPLVVIESVDAVPDLLTVRVFQPKQAAPLSAVLPKLENMGLRVIEDFACTLTPDPAAAPVHLRDFSCALPAPGEYSTATFSAVLSDVLAARAEDDRFNALALMAGLQVREIAVLRAYTRYLGQLREPYGDDYVAATLASHPQLARALVDAFILRLDPDRNRGDGSAARTGADELESRISALTSLDAERIVRRLAELIAATVRSNFFQRDERGEPRPCIALKFDCARIAAMPAPRPWREIFVHGPNVEGVHLRGGAVARGGLRHSDRMSDYRSEILGLFKAQQVKNAVIVPAGAKGGFIVRGAPADRAAVVAAYRDFINGLLDLTDTIEAGDVRALAAHTARLDGDDSYLVVAADKGTATFSDIANELATARGYWLGDAFASGGSAGYDHKRMGITARGAWESVRRHFRELDINVDAESVTVIGVGDMSGDVFGNGMLLSRHLRLVAAFDHRNIFLDPDPDPAVSYAERQRLFALPASSWADYNPALISDGGGVYARSLKHIDLSASLRAALGCSAERVTPDELIRNILQAPVDLLWFGGIGTYVKATRESHDAVADMGNTHVRVDATALRCRVIGEGANLALTQSARIEYAEHGGRLNTDAIDNAAGVNCSDHEVNIKIALDAAIRRGRVDGTQRSALLAAMTDEVARLVLRDNYLHTQAITVSAAQAAERIDRHARLMALLERNDQLDRRLAGLPSDDTLSERRARGVGLTRPELAELLAHTKISVTRALLDSNMPDDPLLNRDLQRYFPAALRDACGSIIDDHPLRREIIVTRVVNSMINRVGSGFVCDMMELAGCDDAAVARAYAVVRDIFELRLTWHAIEALDNLVPATLQTQLLGEVGALVEHATAWLLTHVGPDLSISATAALFRPALATLMDTLSEVLPATEATKFAGRVAELDRLGVPQSLARRIAALTFLHGAGDIVRLAQRFDLGMVDAARIYYAAGHHFGLSALDAKLAAAATADGWEREALHTLRDDMRRHRARLAALLVQLHGHAQPEQAIRQFETLHTEIPLRLVPLGEAICNEAGVSYPRITILNHAWSRTLESSL